MEASWSGSEKLPEASEAGEEPISLRRLRQSLSHLEELERRRHELRDRFQEAAGAPEREAQELRPQGHQDAGGLRLRPPSPLRLNLGLGNRGLTGTPLRHREAHDRPERGEAVMAPPWTERLEPGVPRDSALTLALERSQDRIDELQRERDEAVARAADQEAEVLKLRLMAERVEVQHRQLREERQRDAGELQRLRREHRDSLEQLALQRAEVHQARSTAEEWRSRFELTLAEHRQQLRLLEDSNARATRDFTECSAVANEVSEALFSCLSERTEVLQFLVDLLTALQTLFYDPTPFTKLHVAGPSQAPRARSSSVERSRRRGSGAALGEWLPATPQLRQSSSGVDDLRELIEALEAEIGVASQAFSTQVQRVVAEAEQSARVTVTTAGTSDQTLQRVCGAWIEQERRRRERRGCGADRLTPFIDWGEERARYHAATRSMETKFSQLSKLRRLLQARILAARKRPCKY